MLRSWSMKQHKMEILNKHKYLKTHCLSKRTLFGYWNQLNMMLLNRFQSRRCREHFDLSSHNPRSILLDAERNQSVFNLSKCGTLVKKHLTCLSLWIWVVFWHILRCTNPRAHLHSLQSLWHFQFKPSHFPSTGTLSHLLKGKKQKSILTLAAAN